METTRPSTLEAFRTLAVPVLKARGIRRAGFYGSRVRGDHKSESDLDVVIQCPPEYSLLDLVSLEAELTATLGVEVHLTTYRNLHPAMKDRILSEAQPVL